MNTQEPVQRNDLVSLIEAHIDPDIPKDEIGRVTQVLESGAYEVEFVDEHSKTLAIVPLKPEQTFVFKHHATLTVDDFWQLIEEAKKATLGDMDKLVEWLIDKLSTYSVADILAYEQWFRHYHEKAYRRELWDAAYIINGGCSDDGFMDFRAWLIAQGKMIYEEAFHNPDSLAEVLDADDEAYLEEMNYAQWDAYEKKIGKEFPVFAGIYQRPELQGERVDEADFPQQYPKLYTKF